MDIVLANLEQARVTIARAKFRFYQASIKIVGYIYDTNSCHFNTFKVLKILDWPKDIDINSTFVLIGFCIYYQIWIKNFA